MSLNNSGKSKQSSPKYKAQKQYTKFIYLNSEKYMIDDSLHFILMNEMKTNKSTIEAAIKGLILIKPCKTHMKYKR